MKKLFLLILYISSYSLFSETIVLFSPDDKPAQKLISYIKKTERSLSCAIYSFTHKKIARALIDAHKRGVTVEVVADGSGFDSQYTKLGLLEEHNIPLYIYSDVRENSRRKYDSIMHNKFIIIDNKKLWTGSFNWTNSADTSNQENIIITDDSEVIERYKEQFEILKLRSIQRESNKERELIEPSFISGITSILQKVKKSIIGS